MTLNEDGHWLQTSYPGALYFTCKYEERKPFTMGEYTKNRVGLGARHIVKFGYIYLYTQDSNLARLETRFCQSKSVYDTVS